MASGLRVKGHPIHPMIVPIAITMFLGTFVSDVFYVGTGLLFWFQAAYVCSGLGVIFGLLAAIAGLFEYGTIPRRLEAKKTATLHAAVNLGAWSLFLVSFVFRTRVPAELGIPEMALEGPALWSVVFMSFAGVALLSIGGWLGGHLVYVHGVGITQHAADTRPITQARVPKDQWQPRRYEDQPSRDEAH